MVNLTKKVWHLLDLDNHIKNCLYKGIINKRALAKYIIKKLKQDYPDNKEFKKLHVDAVISSIRRYNIKKEEEKYRAAITILRKAKLATKSGIVSIRLEKRRELNSVISEILRKIDISKAKDLKIIQTDEVTKIIIDQDHLNEIMDMLPKKMIIDISKNLAQVNLKVQHEAFKTPGILNIITTDLVNNDINILDVMSADPGIIFFLAEKDIPRAYQVLYKLFSS